LGSFKSSHVGTAYNEMVPGLIVLLLPVKPIVVTATGVEMVSVVHLDLANECPPDEPDALSAMHKPLTPPIDNGSQLYVLIW
jgi:hypothetical protein